MIRQPGAPGLDESRRHVGADAGRSGGPTGPGVTLAPRVRYAEALPSDGCAARNFQDPAPPVPAAWDALALTSVTRDRHIVNVLRDNLSP